MKKIFINLAVLLTIFTLVSPSASAKTATYIDMGVPTGVDTSFKTYMDWRAVTSTSSPQYKLIRSQGWCDDQGFMRTDANPDWGITADYYMIALGSYYGTEIGTKYRITTSTGNVFYGILGDQKADRHTNSTHQYASNKDVVEFIVDTRYLNRTVKKMGSANVFEPLRGTIAKIERIEFIDSTPAPVESPKPAFLDLKIEAGNIHKFLERFNKERMFVTVERSVENG